MWFMDVLWKKVRAQATRKKIKEKYYLVILKYVLADFRSGVRENK